MRQDELEVLHLPTPSQVPDAVAGKAGVRRAAAPTTHQVHGVRVGGRVPGVEEPLTDPRARHLVLFAKLPSASGPDDRDPLVPPGEMAGERSGLAEPAEVHGIGPSRI